MEMKWGSQICRPLLLLSEALSGRVVLAQDGGGQPPLFFPEFQVDPILCSVITSGRLFVLLAEGTQVLPVLLVSSRDSSTDACGEEEAPEPVT